MVRCRWDADVSDFPSKNDASGIQIMKMAVSTFRSVLMPRASTRVDNAGRSRAISLSLFFVVMCAGLQPAEAAIIQGDRPGESIQAALDIANDGDDILIAPGTDYRSSPNRD